MWIKQFIWKAEHGPKAKYPKARSQGGVVPKKKDQKWVGKYTSPDTGSKKLSGWSAAGMTLFNKLCGINREVCATAKKSDFGESGSQAS